MAANSASSLRLWGSPEAPLTPPPLTFPLVSRVELIHPRDTQLGRKTSPPAFQVTAAPAAEGESVKLGTDGAGGENGVQGIGDGVWAGQSLHAGLGGMTTQWAASGPQHLSGYLSEPLRGLLDRKPQQGGHSGTGSPEPPWGRGGHLSRVKKGSLGTSLPCSPLSLPGLPQPLRLHPPPLSLLCFALSGSGLVFAFH